MPKLSAQTPPMLKLRRTKLLIPLTLTLLALFLFCLNYYLPARKPALALRTSPDVIAIRVIPNYQHYSPQRWYKEQGFAGSPQSLIIDGYEAIKEGRTVYVNAANLSSGATPTLYTNIYLMSYNQDADSDTIAIVNQLLQHWHFNTDLQDVGKCVDAEGNLGDVCLIDPECPKGEYCNSAKARVTRDTKRLEDLAEMKIALKAYKNKHNRYPDLAAGSYLPNNTLSTWPSWQDTFANELNITLPADPINKLGQCDGYDQTTCWNQENKKFADSDLADPELNLPTDSRAYVYTAAANGASSTICAVMESGLVNTLEQGACYGSESRQHAAGTENHTPQFTGANLPTGYSGEPYQGFVSAVDPDGDELIWTITFGACDLWNNLRQENTAVENQKAVLADNAGQAGIPSCSFNVTINDSRGGIANQNYTIDVINGNVPIIQAISDKTVTIGKNFSFTVLAAEADSQYPLTFVFTGLPANFTNSFTDIANDPNQHDYHLNGLVEASTGDYSVIVTASDIYEGMSTSVNFTVTVENQAPSITSTPVINATACVDYSYDVNANDPDGHIVQYFDLTNSLPANLTINQITGEITGQPQMTGIFPIQIEAQDQYFSQTIAPYSAEGIQNYNLTVSDEVFTVTAPADDSFYVAPAGVPIASLYHFPITYFGVPVKSTANPVVWSRTVNPALPAGMTIVINPGTGDINASATDNINNPGTYTVTVTAINYCGASYSDSFDLTVISNEWCGFVTNELWHWDGSGAVEPGYNQVMMTPVVADLDQDGMPEIIFNTFNPAEGHYYSNNILRAVRGDNGASVFDVTNSSLRTDNVPIAVGNIDGDPELEIITKKSGYCNPFNAGDTLASHACHNATWCADTGAVCESRAIAFEHDGTFKWQSDVGISGHYASIADLDEDGTPEIITSNAVLNNDGTTRWLGGGQAVANLDMAGHPEVVSGCKAYHYDGSVYWDICGTYSSGRVAIGNFDADDFPEIVVVSSGKVRLHEHNGTLKWQISVPALNRCSSTAFQSCTIDADCPGIETCRGGGGSPTIADFDNDGEPEIGVAGCNGYVVIETDGTIKWQKTVQDRSSCATGSSVFDFNNDGEAEVLYNDELSFRIYRGSTGEVLYETLNGSGTLVEYPIVVDVNNDNESEIVVPANDYAFGSHAGIRVFGNAHPLPLCSWVNTRQIWNQHSYHVTNVNDDGTIPQFEQNNWEIYNNYRQNIMVP